ncbi:hypothetical protein B0H34DRAFT_854545 [Crassisporium funariophilum]|nr:hypothetical protein B0H34DRAFT_854545 [Crassisporium funariophilum]
MALQADTQAERRNLKKILRNAVELMNIARPAALITQHPVNLVAPIPVLVLPSPNDILAPIFTIDFPEKIRGKLIQRLTRWVGKLQQIYSSNYRTTCLALARASGTNQDNNMNAIARAYEAHYRRNCISAIRSIGSCQAPAANAF